MILDGHIHIRDGAADRAGFSQRLQEAGVDGGTLLSIPPPCFDIIAMYIDLTPGTPPIYRREALTKLFAVGHDVAHNVIYGSDCAANDHNAKWAREWINRDNGIYQERGLEQDTRAGIYGENLKRFLSLQAHTSMERARALPRPGQ